MKFSVSVLFLLQGLSSCNGLRKESAGRSLFEALHSYTPMTLVTDAAALDRDIHVIKRELQKETQRGWDNAENIYREGAFSKPVAKLTLHDPLEADVPEGTVARGLDTDGYEVSGKLYKEAKANDQQVLIQYEINEVFANYVNCQVGANPAPNVGGCFNSTGNLTLNDEQFSYDYDVFEENVNYRNLADLSGKAEEKMWECSHCPFPDFEKFYDYYGAFNYADRIITNAFRGEETSLKNGNMDFGFYTEYGLSEFLHKAMSYLSIWMYTIRQMEEALAECDKGDFQKGVHYWDEAVAYYTGSRSLQPNSDGELIFHQAEMRCDEFVTCGETSDSREGMSYVNIQAFKHFDEGQKNIQDKHCDLAEKNKERIVTMMTIPLIQGTLRYAHIISHEAKFYEKHGAEATLFSLSVLPLVHSCSKHDAKIIYENLKAKNTADVNFAAVKKAFENTYQCLNIQCSEVGGIWDVNLGDYKPAAFPCGLKDNTMWVILGGVAGCLLMISGIGMLVLRRRRERAEEAVAKLGPSEDDFTMEDVPMEDMPVEDDDKVFIT